MEKKIRLVLLAAVCCCGWGLSASSEQALPDLIVNVRSSDVIAGSCRYDDPIASGNISILNKGTADAKMRQATSFFRTKLAIYVPENIDFFAKELNNSLIRPTESRRVKFNLGEKKNKKGRNYNGLAVNDEALVWSTEADALKKDSKLLIIIQKFLSSKRLNVKVDGVFGAQTLSALNIYQGVNNLPGRREWNAETAQHIWEIVHGKEEKVIKNIITLDDDGKKLTTVTIFAVVDPYDLIKESNERNNLAVFKIKVPYCE